MYMEELNDSRISTRDSSALIRILLEFSIGNSSFFEKYKPNFLELYVKAVLNAKERPSRLLAESFQPLFMHIEHEDFQILVVPSSIKMLKRNPEIVMESIADLLRHVNLDMSKYVIEFLSVILPQVRHADDERRTKALSIIASLSQSSSDPDVLLSMFNAVKAIIEGSEGKLALPYQRIGMINALAEMSRAPSGKALNKLAPMVSTFLLSCYKGDGSDEVKLAILSSLGSWASRSAETVQPNVISFLSSGIKEKEILRKGHLKCLRIICKNSDSLTKAVPLLDLLVQIVKLGFTKASQRLDGIYALFSVAKIVSIDTKGEEIVLKEKLWHLLAQNESALISFSLVPKLSDEDCVTCIDVLEVLLVEHQYRSLEFLSVKSLFQLLLYFICHPSWDVRKVAYDATRKIISSSMKLAEELLLQFRNWFPVISDRISVSDTESRLDSHITIAPSAEELVKCLLLIVPAAMASSSTYSVLFFCAHHPSLAGISISGAVWKRLQRNLRRHNSDIIEIMTANVGLICKDLLGSKGLMSSNSLEQSAALQSLSTLMRITPNETFSEFSKHFDMLLDSGVNDTLSENDIKVIKLFNLSTKLIVNNVNLVFD
ncbi:protein ILITYHIA-like [Phalaenopsis equestris]|uniref:protein ILITYHIA-like n=1 Tax=Phalaenopsis equestris TaxID=78828 RepID=UPI0009E3A641|nr:protein ILITYHIA-like [Phalaenopsis equestris]